MSIKSFFSEILGKDPELKYTPKRDASRQVSVWPPMTDSRTRKATGRTAPNGTTSRRGRGPAEIAGEYLKKGSKVYIEGSLRTHSWDDKTSGQKKYMTEIIVNDLVMLSGRGEGAAGGDFAGSSRGASSSASEGGNNFDQRTPEPEPAAAGPITDEDIPF